VTVCRNSRTLLLKIFCNFSHRATVLAYRRQREPATTSHLIASLNAAGEIQ